MNLNKEFYRVYQHIYGTFTLLFKQNGTKFSCCHLSRSLTTQSSAHRGNEIKNEYDIVISGGGLVGFAAGCSLGRSPMLCDKKILLLERQPYRPWTLPEDFSNRVCALNSSTQQLFVKSNVWPTVEKLRCQPVKQIQVWDACSEAVINFDKHELTDTIAHIVENDVIVESLKQHIPENVDVMYDARISQYVLPPSSHKKVEVIMNDGKVITTDLLIGADGAKSSVREAMKTQYLTWEYDQMGIVATLELSEEIENYVAWQKFLPTGPIAFLPLSSNRSSMVWSVTKNKAKTLLALSDVEFMDELNRAIWQDQPPDPIVQNVYSKFFLALQTVTSNVTHGVKQLPPNFSAVVPKSRAAFPLGLGHSAHYVKPRVALVGDAAHRVHPLAGQGVNLGFGDVGTLLETLEKSLRLGENLGNERALHSYETKRQRHNVASMVAIDSLYRLYSTTFTPLVLLRSIGLSLVDSLSPVKKKIMEHAAG